MKQYPATNLSFVRATNYRKTAYNEIKSSSGTDEISFPTPNCEKGLILLTNMTLTQGSVSSCLKISKNYQKYEQDTTHRIQCLFVP